MKKTINFEIYIKTFNKTKKKDIQSETTRMRMLSATRMETTISGALVKSTEAFRITSTITTF